MERLEGYFSFESGFSTRLVEFALLVRHSLLGFVPFPGILDE